MRLNRLAVLLAAASCSATIAPSAWAQDARRDELVHRVQSERLAAEQADQGKVLVSLDFPGGTLTEWVDALTQAAKPEPANIILRGDAERIPIGPTKLDNVPLSAAIDVVSGNYQIGDASYMVSNREYQEAAGRSVFAVQVTNAGRRAPRNTQQPANRDIAVLQVKELTTALPGDPPEAVVPAETILTAIEAVLEVAGDDGKTDVKYHAPSGLVMLSGPVSSLRAAEEVLHELSQDVMLRRQRARQLQSDQGLDRPEQLESELAKAQAEMELAHVRMLEATNRHEVAAEQLEQAKALAEQGLASDNDVNGFKLRLIKSQAEIEEEHIRAKLEKQTVEQLRRSLDRARAIASGSGTTDGIHALRAENTMLRDRLAAMEAELVKLRKLFAAPPAIRNRSRGGSR